MRAIAGTVVSAAALWAGAAQAEVTAKSDDGFAIALAVDTAADKDQAWRELLTPSHWWSPLHTWSGDAANLYIDGQATGCFCEKLPRPKDAPEGQRMGSVEHLHVVYADPQAGLLRMTGGLGPLQAEPVRGILTVTLKPGAGGTQIELTYRVAGFVTMKGTDMAPLVDKVLSEQLTRLADRLNTAPEPAPAP